MASLHRHRVHLFLQKATLRPMTESDWDTLLRWNQDPRVLAEWDAGKVVPWTLEKLQKVYRGLGTLIRSGLP